MIVRCVSQYPNQKQLDLLGAKFLRDRTFQVTVGKEYIVFGLTIGIEPDYAGRGLFIHHLSDSPLGYVVSTPACLFEIVDGTASRYWEVRLHNQGTITLWPSSFYREYYHDDLTSLVPEVIQDFERVRKTIEAEALGRADHAASGRRLTS
jgi:hypothetical protein